MASAPNLTERIARLIDSAGPLRLDAFMQLCLHDRAQGYYTQGESFGAAGDFITAPEISPLFALALANWIKREHAALGSPAQWRLLELGPGRGALLETVLTALPPEIRPQKIECVEASSALQGQILARLTSLGFTPSFVEELGFLPACNLPTLVLANEYFDALPIRQFVKEGEHVFELYVGLDPDRALCFVRQDGGAMGEAQQLADGGYGEVSAPTVQHFDFIRQELKASGGAALVIDYGYVEAPGTPTFQALKDHASVSPLDDPGAADLTAHVDFGALSALLSHHGVPHRLETQADLLTRLDLDALLTAHPQEAMAAARLIRPEAMGTLFKALSFALPRDLPHG